MVVLEGNSHLIEELEKTDLDIWHHSRERSRVL